MLIYRYKKDLSSASAGFGTGLKKETGTRQKKLLASALTPAKKSILAPATRKRYWLRTLGQDIKKYPQLLNKSYFLHL